MSAELVLRDAGGVTTVGSFRATATGLVVDGNPTYEEWEAFGGFLQRMERSVLWLVGDWLNEGEKRYGEMYSQAVEVTGLEYQTLVNAKVIAKRFESNRRRLNLGFTHHAEVAALPPDHADAILDRAEAENLSSREVRALVRQLKNAAAAGTAQPGGDTGSVADLAALVARGHKYGTIYADPPWAYSNQATRASTDNHYGTMSVDEIAALPVGHLAADQSHLWLWTTNAFLFECPRLFDAWGFEFKSSFVWVKPQMGIGNYLRNSHEFLLLAVRGGLTAAARDVMSWGEYPRAAHSSKPESVRADVVERLSPGPRLELFGRAVVEGWHVWGDQVGRYNLFTHDAPEVG